VAGLDSYIWQLQSVTYGTSLHEHVGMHFLRICGKFHEKRKAYDDLALLVGKWS
jgi:hypothetical protein